jgi:hypothetical protein
MIKHFLLQLKLPLSKLTLFIYHMAGLSNSHSEILQMFSMKQSEEGISTEMTYNTEKFVSTTHFFTVNFYPIVLISFRSEATLKLECGNITWYETTICGVPGPTILGLKFG